jgi:hypothetical protein
MRRRLLHKILTALGKVCSNLWKQEGKHWFNGTVPPIICTFLTQGFRSVSDWSYQEKDSWSDSKFPSIIISRKIKYEIWIVCGKFALVTLHGMRSEIDVGFRRKNTINLSCLNSYFCIAKKLVNTVKLIKIPYFHEGPFKILTLLIVQWNANFQS